MFANTQGGGTDLAFPDVCLTPSPGGPVPLPYPNVAARPTATGAVYHVLYGGTPVHNLGTEIPFSNGDNAGVNSGVVSGKMMGASKCLTGAMTVLIGGMPATRLTSTTLQNGTNAPGVALVPSQVKVLLLAP